MQTLTPPTTSPDPMRSRRYWLRAAAAVILAGGVVAAAIALLRDDDSTITSDSTPVETSVAPATASAQVATTSPATIPESTATFVGATVETFPVDLDVNPYFVAAGGDAWVGSLAGQLVRLNAAGKVVDEATISESSPFIVDANGMWVADAKTGDVVRLDPDTGDVVAVITTGVEIIPNTFKNPMLGGTARDFATLGGIGSSNESVWVGDRTGSVMRIDPATNAITGTFDVPVTPDHVRADGEHVIVVYLRGGDIAVLDDASGEVIQEFGGFDDLTGAELFGGAVYVQGANDGVVTRIDIATGEQTSSAALGASVIRDHDPTWPTGLAVSAAGVLVDTANEPDSLHVLDPNTLEDLGTLAVTADQGNMTISSDGSAWLVRSLANEVVHLTPRSL